MDKNINQICEELYYIEQLSQKLKSLRGDIIEMESDTTEEDEIIDDAFYELTAFQDSLLNPKKLPVPKSVFHQLPPPSMPPETLVIKDEISRENKDISKMAKNLKISSLCGIIGLPCMIICLVLSPFWDTGLMLSIIGMFLFAYSAIYWKLHGKETAKAIAEWEISLTKWQEQYQAWMQELSDKLLNKDKYIEDFIKYETAFANIEKQCLAKNSALSAKANSKIAAIHKKKQAKLQKLKAESDAILKERSSHTILHYELVDHAGRIAKILAMGRASNLETAINLALADIDAEKQEATRREEALRQEELLREQAEEARLHNIRMEKETERQADELAQMQREHNRVMEKEAKRQADAAKKQADLAAKQSHAPCFGCANFKKCTASTRSRATANCGGFRPK